MERERADQDTAVRHRGRTDEAALRERGEVESRRVQRWAHVSSLAALSLIIGTASVAATLTGLLAPIGFAGGILAIVIGLVAMAEVRRAGVTGHSLVTIGILLGAAAIVLGVLAMGHHIAWLDSRTDEVARAHTWLNNHMHWLRRF